MKTIIDLSGRELKEAISKYLNIEMNQFRIVHVASIFGDNKTTIELDMSIEKLKLFNKGR